MTIPERLQRLWDRVPETQVANIERNSDSWNIHGGDLTTDQAHDLAAGPIERWLRINAMGRLVIEGNHTDNDLAWVVKYGEGKWSQRSTKIEVLLAAAERVVGLETI